jgi:hypothetical protein
VVEVKPPETASKEEDGSSKVVVEAKPPETASKEEEAKTVDVDADPVPLAV